MAQARISRGSRCAGVALAIVLVLSLVLVLADSTDSTAAVVVVAAVAAAVIATLARCVLVSPRHRLAPPIRRRRFIHGVPPTHGGDGGGGGDPVDPHKRAYEFLDRTLTDAQQTNVQTNVDVPPAAYNISDAVSLRITTQVPNNDVNAIATKYTNHAGEALQYCVWGNDNYSPSDPLAMFAKALTSLVVPDVDCLAHHVLAIDVYVLALMCALAGWPARTLPLAAFNVNSPAALLCRPYHDPATNTPSPPTENTGRSTFRRMLRQYVYNCYCNQHRSPATVGPDIAKNCADCMPNVHHRRPAVSTPCNIDSISTTTSRIFRPPTTPVHIDTIAPDGSILATPATPNATPNSNNPIRRDRPRAWLAECTRCRVCDSIDMECVKALSAFRWLPPNADTPPNADPPTAAVRACIKYISHGGAHICLAADSPDHNVFVHPIIHRLGGRDAVAAATAYKIIGTPARPALSGSVQTFRHDLSANRAGTKPREAILAKLKCADTTSTDDTLCPDMWCTTPGHGLCVVQDDTTFAALHAAYLREIAYVAGYHLAMQPVSHIND